MWTQIKAAVGRSRGLARRTARLGLEWTKRAVRPIPIVNVVCRSGFRLARRLRRQWRAFRTVAAHCARRPECRRFLATAFRTVGPRAWREAVPVIVPGLAAEGEPLRDWYARFRPTRAMLARFRARRWPADAPKFSILMPVHNVREDWLRQAVASVIDQTYPRWELICVNDGSTAAHVQPTLDDLAARDPRVRVIHLGRNRGVSVATNRALEAATGRYVGFMDHDDYLEPQALHRFAEAVLQDAPDLLHSDEILTTEEIDQFIAIPTACRFSYDYYVSHPYFVHLIAVRTDLLRRVGGLDEAMPISQDVDTVLRLLEVCTTVSYVPDVLYRWRIHPGSLGHRKMALGQEMTRGALERHFRRIGVEATVIESDVVNFRDVIIRSESPARVAILIPTKDHAALLRTCVESLERTVDPGLADIVVIDHQSVDPTSRAYLDELGRRHRVVTHEGPFNYSAIMNRGVAAVRGPYTHYLFLNNDTEAIEPGWLDHMLGFGRRRDVGIVGAALLYPNGGVQHGGVVIGLYRYAEHAHKFWPFRAADGRREPGRNGGLLANREFSAVTAACMLIRADVFDEVGGFDESLAVGFNDTDLCLRVRSRGYKVIQDNQAVLRHDESQTRGTSTEDAHPADSARFLDRHRALIFGGDPFYSPLLSKLSTSGHLRPGARSPFRLKAITAPVGLPVPVAESRVARADGPGTSPRAHSPARSRLGLGRAPRGAE